MCLNFDIEITEHGDAMTLEDDIITVSKDKEYSTRDRTIFLKQPLDGSWIVCAVVKEMGDGKNKSQPIILGKLSKNSHLIV